MILQLERQGLFISQIQSLFHFVILRFLCLAPLPVVVPEFQIEHKGTMRVLLFPIADRRLFAPFHGVTQEMNKYSEFRSYVYVCLKIVQIPSVV